MVPEASGGAGGRPFILAERTAGCPQARTVRPAVRKNVTAAPDGRGRRREQRVPPRRFR